MTKTPAAGLFLLAFGWFSIAQASPLVGPRVPLGADGFVLETQDPATTAPATTPAAKPASKPAKKPRAQQPRPRQQPLGPQQPVTRPEPQSPAIDRFIPG
jgi:hypothetical protein